MAIIPRQAETALARWFDGPRRRPLVLRGARQVGKSTLVRRFAGLRGLTLAEVNLEQHSSLGEAFESFDVPRMLLELGAVSRTTIDASSLLFLDEVQAVPSALAALRYLYEERPDIAVIAAGSLLEFVLQEHGFSMPVGRIEFMHLGPLSFEEFLEGMADSYLGDSIRSWDVGDPWPDAAHRALLDRHREFLFVGGMPEAAAAFAAGEGPEAVRRVQSSIVDTYREDFAKYAPARGVLARVRRVFDYVPAGVGRKVKYSAISREDRSRDVSSALDLLALARVIWRVHHVQQPGVPLRASSDPNVFKCLFMDVGLMGVLSGVTWANLGRADERSLISEGGLAEQFIGQHLLFLDGESRTPELHYWLREGRSNNAEVDYLIELGQRTIPVEVKSGASGRMRSLHQFHSRTGSSDAQVALRFDLNPPSVSTVNAPVPGAASVSYSLLSLPSFMVGQTARLIDGLLHS